MSTSSNTVNLLWTYRAPFTKHSGSSNCYNLVFKLFPSPIHGTCDVDYWSSISRTDVPPQCHRHRHRHHRTIIPTLRRIPYKVLATDLISTLEIQYISYTGLRITHFMYLLALCYRITVLNSLLFFHTCNLLSCLHVHTYHISNPDISYRHSTILILTTRSIQFIHDLPPRFADRPCNSSDDHTFP